MFGRDHAGVGSYYDPYDAHRIFDQILKGSLNIKPVRVLEWWYCPVCGEVRPEVFEKIMEAAEHYGFGSPFCSEEYLAQRQPVFELLPL